MSGQCYNFFLILRTIFPNASAYYDGNHIYTKIDNKFYDIRGKHHKIKYLKPLDFKCPHKPHRWAKSDTRKLS